MNTMIKVARYHCDRRHRDRASISALKLTGQGILPARRWSLALERFL